MGSNFISGQKILLWRRKMLLKGGRKVDIDWLLDIAAGVSWSKLQRIILDPEIFFFLEISIHELEDIWESHLNDQTPLQYLIAKCPWRDFELEVSSDALIPRQETELLIDFALKKVQDSNFGRWADLGTGSGALAISLSKMLPNWRGHAVDISQDALKLAKKNLKTLVPNANVNLSLGDWWEPLIPWWGSFDLVLSNPPYIPSDLIQNLEPIVQKHEPHIALDGGEDGLSSFKTIISGALNALSKGGWLILEHHHDQSEKVLELMKNNGLNEVSFENDLNGIKRFAMCCKSEK